MSRTIYGVVNADGSVASGGGFTVLHPTEGNYVINFNQAFSTIPSVVVMHIWEVNNPGSAGGAITDTATVVGMNRNSAKVHTGFVQSGLGGGGVLDDRSFAFIAVGG